MPIYDEASVPGTAAGRSTTDVGATAGANPFNIPADEEIFRFREEERARKEQDKLIAQTMRVADKTTFAAQMQATATADARTLLRELRPPKGPKATTTLAASSVGTLDRRKEKENMADFIAKKREIFLLQMSLDTKRAEIKKLEERARQREEALKKSEQMLEEDALRFDAFLKENDEKVQEAIKKAEAEAKAKQDKVLEIKRLNTATAALRSELNKYEEQLEDCRRYKEFLDSITPPEWFEQQAAKLQRRKDALVAEWQSQCEALKQRREAALAAKTAAESDYANARTQQQAERAERAIKESVAALKEIMKEKEPQPPNLDFEMDPEDEEMYFQEPGQLLAVYKQLEESNLFYIQNAQETEEALEELRQKLRDTKTRMDAEAQGLQGQVSTLQASIVAAREKAKRLKDRTLENEGAFTLSMGSSNAPTSSVTGSSGPGGPVNLKELGDKVREVYVRCGFDADASISTLQMLTNIEMKLEEYLNLAEGMTPDYVDGAEKAREKDRRKVARDEKLSTQHREHEARMARALERAAAPVFKKTGKPLMFRSAPPQRKKVVQADDRNDEEAELEAYLAQDMI
ncbi:hypothetical protein CHLRE_02g103950v5 [Chlamydomonas reinhardtii]|uniref:Cilia- and flagella-associated protein 100 n=2 Tax=Chlamydomonas reinhardtii TaxID=3055 RepID=CP100_CHLRE|nr:uncharacterized protein CHLRE_02g103950v5 [Chlamydomonas reinhardtii]A8I4E9.1 RecName: Full=Cilia- and flagella-associated protein 100; AltName: Full=Flagella-associated protein 100; AltName: Full=Modifier of inner arms 1 protein; Short=Mia1p [Chlamydomonas reinhardtii]PNW86981.1 hypothetical protein CHLRE_02g103950v5 [Chlamydomonas reinhardtii]8GLV_AW Chain AW, Cilia- and flagella-associated protein 100 [Chlamydomonas reinhardtii]BAM95825.1 flagellar associated protein 100 [Chlamydomonas re|eukprot:XP_001699777.1 flagellar associated protein [Chlamydomonas reinhardtii]